MIKTIAAALLLAATATSALGASTGMPPNYTLPDGSKGFAFYTEGGVDDPELIVAFNPQPDPPGFGGTRFMIDGDTAMFVTPASEGGGYEVEFGLLLPTLLGALPLPAAPNSDGHTGESFVIDGQTFDLALSFSGPGAVDDWASFNPQPDPPGDSFGVTFGFEAEGDPGMTVQLSENGSPLSLSPVPEPAGWVLMLLGVAVLGGALRARVPGTTTLAPAPARGPGANRVQT
jgi:hypothetical protein